MQRIVRAAFHGFFQDVHQQITTIRSAILACFVHLRTMEILDDVVRIWNAAHDFLCYG